MTRRALFNGLFWGIMLVLAALYPVLSVLVPVLMPSWKPPLENSPILHAVLLMLSAVIGLIALLLPPILTVNQTNTRSFFEGMKLGGITGFIMGVIFTSAIASPLNHLSGWQLLQPFTEPALNQPSASATVSYAIHVFSSGANVTLWTIASVIVLNALLGGFAAWGRRNHTAPPLTSTLFDLVVQRKAKRWLDACDESTSVGLWVGIIVGVLVWLSEAQNFYLGFARIWPELGDLLSQSLGNTMVIRSFPFPPILVFTFCVMGGVIVGLIKDPQSRFFDRLMGVIFGFDIAFIIWYLQLTRSTNFYQGVAPFLLQRALDNNMMPDASPFVYQLPPLIAQPVIQLALTFITPWLIIPVVLILSLTLGIISGTFYALITPVFLPRPVDRAARFRRIVKYDPAKTLTTFYSLFAKDSRANDVLVHVAIDAPRKMADVAKLAAAYHTMVTSRADQARMAAEAAAIMKDHPDWRYSKEIGSVMRSLNIIVTADSLESLQKVPEPQVDDTTSLPPAMIKAVARIRAVFEELQKVWRVNDLQTKLTFFNDALEAIRVAQNFVNKEMRDPKTSASVYPEQPLLSTALDRWQEMVQIAMKRLKGRADVIVELKSHRVTQSARLPITLTVRNRGLNVAERVYIKAMSGEDYYLAQPSEQNVGILSAGAQCEVTLFVEPKPNVKRLRLQWEVSFDDSVEAARHAEFADIAEFVTPDKPFQKIFPIPYVTGTPLKDSSVFVGRQDIFEFVKENLLGAHQNNVIILHGQRRTGKTSVLYRLGDALRETHVAVLIDMQGKPARGEADFLFSIADDIVYALEKENIQVELPDRKAFEESPEFFFSSRFIRSLREPLGKRNLLLLFDEFEELQRRVEDKKLSPEIFQFLRNLMQHEEKLDFIFSGTHKLEELGSDYWSALFNIAVYKPITFLSHAEVRRLISEPVAQYNLEYDPLAVEMMVNLTAGHPYFTQLLLHEVIVYYNETERSYLTSTDVEQAVNRVMERGEAHFKYIWTESSEAEQRIMRLLAEGLVSKRELTMADLDKLSCDISGCELEMADAAALPRLVERDIVLRNGNVYRFTVPLIEKWVRHTNPMMR